MLLMTWKESLSTDVNSIDQQHQDLIAQVEKFFAAVHGGLDRRQLLAGLDVLIEMVSDHFAHEERVMRNIHLPTWTVHERLHRALLEEISEFREEVAMGSNERSAADVEHFLNIWLYRHIVEEDLKIFHHLNRD
ncbi:putative Bacteriohemerythrin [Magnetospirillum gryphiswaldense MSR-1 v2]|uniref:Bacteriohemerythrin n=2 Tax=Magnetospirillum gryphiswaldense TaxID=55518 RepID=V6EY03_MAGGM|nr:putative Bacteriohemerythrin [Magnetospirillum gryphiswaldense MSR-1 v2]